MEEGRAAGSPVNHLAPVAGHAPFTRGTRPQMTEAPPEPVKAKPVRTGPKWEQDARDRVKAALRKFNRPLTDLVGRDANEGDTRLLVTDFLTEGLGFDKYADLTTEYAVKGEFADYGVRIDKELIAFIEVKRVATKLGLKHLRQVEMYAVNEGVEWMILTNGVQWQAYHLTAGLPVIIDLALDVDLLAEDRGKADKLFHLSREAMSRRVIDELWKAQRATSPKSLALVISSPSVAKAIRLELKRQTGHAVEEAEIIRLMRATVFRAEAVDAKGKAEREES